MVRIKFFADACMCMMSFLFSGQFNKDQSSVDLAI